MKRDYSSSLSTLQVKTLLAMIAVLVFPAVIDCAYIASVSDSIVKQAVSLFPSVFSIDCVSACFAFVQSAIARKAYELGIINLFDYVTMLAKEKESNAEKLNDKGAFGDLFEILVRIAIIGNYNLVQASALTVAEFKRIDVESKRYGKIEIGCNGKTWTQGTMFDYMAGNYDSVIYGMFSDIDKRLIITYCKQGNITQAIKEIKKRCGYWKDKYAFMDCLNHLGKNGKEIKAFSIRSGKIMNQFNDNMYYRFMEEIENGNITTL